MNNRLTRWLAWRMTPRAMRIIYGRKPDFVIGGKADPYMLRWYVIPRNPLFNIYLHVFMRDDDDRALHDHPWWSASLLLGLTKSRRGFPPWVVTPDVTLHEVYRDRRGRQRERTLTAGALVLRGARFAHRMVVPTPGTMTLFVTGPRVREWGFLCPKGWRHWKEFTAPGDSARVGKGCD